MRERLRSTGFLLPAWFSPSSSLRVAFHRARGVRIGREVEIGYCVIIDNLYPDLVTIEEGATVSAKSTILAHDESQAYTGRGPAKVAPTIIKRGAFVGVHAVVMPGITIGERAVVGAGAIVTRDVPAMTTVVGVPAKELVR